MEYSLPPPPNTPIIRIRKSVLGYSDIECEKQSDKKDENKNFRSLQLDLKAMLLDKAKIRIKTTDDSILTVRRAN